MPVGRPLKITKKVIETICDAIQIGTPLSSAAVYGGITYRTFQYWIDKGKEEADRLMALSEGGEGNPQPDPSKVEFFQFFLKVEEAKANAIVGWTNTINQAANTSPEWARYMLSKWSPELHGEQPQKVELTGAGGGPVTFREIVVELPTEEEGG